MKKKTKETIINIGTGKDYTIKEYANIILKKILPKQNVYIKYDTKKPNGTPQKVLDISLAKKYGWYSKTKISDAILITYNHFLKKNEI